MNTPQQEELEMNARFRAAALEPVIEKLAMIIDLMIQIRNEQKKHHEIIEKCL
jgi:hypothetical protein